MKKKIVVFSGAGLDRESGILTFRDCEDGLWNNYKIDEVATPKGWDKDPKKVLDFYNLRRQELSKSEPNEAHKLLVSLEEKCDVTHITQNVSDLLERVGCSNVLHLHGELTKVRASKYDNNVLDTVIDVGYNDVNIGDVCPVTGSQLRPHVVWFEENVFNFDKSFQKMRNADILIIIGTSLQIGYTLDMIKSVRKGVKYKDDCKIIFIDPNPVRYLDRYGLDVEYITMKAADGVKIVVGRLLNE